jgi:hypothetical protein
MTTDALQSLIDALETDPTSGGGSSTGQQPLNYGLTPEDGKGDPLRTTFAKIQNNFTDLDSRLLSTTATLNTLSPAAFAPFGSTLGTVADGSALTAEIGRAQTAEATNATNITANATAIANEVSRAQAAEALKAPIASPAFTGIPTAPTAAAGTGTNQIATCQFVATAVAAGGGGGGGTGGVPTSRQILTAGLATGGGDLTADRTITVTKASQADVATGTDDTKALTSYSIAAALGAKAPLASPALVGTPTAPTATAGTNTTQIATTAFVAGSYAPLTSPAFTGTPTVPTAAAGTSTTQAASTAFVAAAFPATAVRLDYTNATTLTLSQKDGASLYINGVNRPVPSAGVTLSNGGLAANTSYYVYAYWTGSAVALLASTAGHVADATSGLRVAAGDATATLVGAAVTNASGQFQAAPLTASYFNRRGVTANTGQVTASTGSGTAAELSTSLRAYAWVWGDEVLDVAVSGYGQQNTSVTGYYGYMQASADGSAFGPVSAGGGIGSPAAAWSYNSPLASKTGTDGLRYGTVYAYVTVGVTGTFSLATVVKTRG